MSDVQMVLSSLSEVVTDGDPEEATRLVRRLLDLDVPPLDVIDRGLAPGIQAAGDLWEEGDFFLPELVAAAEAMKSAIELLRPLLEGSDEDRGGGRVVIGTVQGDIHDIGKTLVATLLSANGFTVYDEGVDVPVDRFVERAREVGADLVCASALLTTTMSNQRELIEAVRASGTGARVMVGGAPVTAEWAERIGADGYADNAVTAVKVARRLVNDKE